MRNNTDFVTYFSSWYHMQEYTTPLKVHSVILKFDAFVCSHLFSMNVHQLDVLWELWDIALQETWFKQIFFYLPVFKIATKHASCFILIWLFLVHAWNLVFINPNLIFCACIGLWSYLMCLIKQDNIILFLFLLTAWKNLMALTILSVLQRLHFFTHGTDLNNWKSSNFIIIYIFNFSM